MTDELTFKQLKPFILADIKANLTPVLLSRPGTGKSKFLQSLAQELHTRVFILACNQLADKADLTGARMIKDDAGHYKQFFFPHERLMDAISYAGAHKDETPIVFMDEFNRTGADVTSAIFTFITDRCVGSVKFPDNIRFVVAGNDAGNITSVDQASISRLMIYHVKPDIETFFAVQSNLNRYIAEVLTRHPEDLLSEAVSTEKDDDSDTAGDDDDSLIPSIFDEDGTQFNQITVPRTITALSDWLNTMGLTGALDQEEQNKLATYLNLIPSVSQTPDAADTLLTALVGHTGDTVFTHHVYDFISEQYRASVARPQTAQAAPDLFAAMRPSDVLVNTLTQAGSVDDIENLMASLSAPEIQNTFAWLFSARNVATVNNIDAVRTFIQTAGRYVSTLEKKQTTTIVNALNGGDNVSTVTTSAIMSAGPSDPLCAEMKKYVTLFIGDVA